MKGLRNLGVVPLVVLVALLMATGFAAAQPPTPTQSDTTGSIIPELEGIPRDQQFDHFRGGQFTVTDAQGNAATYMVTAGTVAGITGSSVDVTPNGQTTAVGFTVTPDTKVHAMPNTGSLQALATGDKVMVLSRQGSDAAVMIAKHRMGMMGMGHGGMWE